MKYKIGAHLSMSGGYDKAVERVCAIGGNCLQLFSASPRGWHFASVTHDQQKLFFDARKTGGIDTVFFHASYLVNLADEGAIGEKSVQSLTAELTVAAKLDITGSIIHLGSYKKDAPTLFDTAHDRRYRTLLTNITKVLDATPKNTFFIIENAGNQKIGKELNEIAAIIRDVNSPRLKVCLDTCHLYSAGYDLSTPALLNSFLDTFDAQIGLDKLTVFHFNDSKDPFRSGRDRHENIGQGSLTLAPFRTIMQSARTREIPFIIETPGFDGKGPDKKNIDILKKIIGEV